MATIDVERLLAEVSSDQPSGENLEYDPLYGELERSAQGKEEQQFGDTIIPAEDPDWKAVRKNALELFPRTKDLRVGMYLVQAVVGQDGMLGLRDGLQVIHGLITRFWDTVHPELDPDDDNDPTMRVNVLVTLCAPSMLRKVREAPLVSHRVLGRFSLRDVQVVNGQMALPEGRPAPDAASLDAAFMEIDLEELQATADAVVESIAAVQQIEDVVTDQVGASQAPDLSGLRDVLKEVKHELDQRLSRRGVTVGEADEPGDPAAAGGVAGAAAAGAPQRMKGEITCREDVVRMLDKACQYFARNEPTSPVPLILERAKRLIGKNFLEILRDMAPDGLQQAQNVAGVTDEG